MNWDTFHWKPMITAQVATALKEDLGDGTDITAALIDKQSQGTATLISRENAVLCGVAWFNEAFLQCDAHIDIHWHCEDGDAISPNVTLCELRGNSRAILTAERTALNFLQTLSGTATTTRAWCQLLKGTKTKLLDTRKTIPGLRWAQKYAVHCGGGHNHRMGLWDAFLIKENHIASCGSITKAIEQAKRMHPHKKIEVEVENLIQLEEALANTPDVIMLDNFGIEDIQRAVNKTQGRIPLEVSGNVDSDTIKRLSALGVDFISSGGLTKHVQAVDFSLRIHPPF